MNHFIAICTSSVIEVDPSPSPWTVATQQKYAPSVPIVKRVIKQVDYQVSISTLISEETKALLRPFVATAMKSIDWFISCLQHKKLSIIDTNIFETSGLTVAEKEGNVFNFHNRAISDFFTALSRYKLLITDIPTLGHPNPLYSDNVINITPKLDSLEACLALQAAIVELNQLYPWPPVDLTERAPVFPPVQNEIPSTMSFLCRPLFFPGIESGTIIAVDCKFTDTVGLYAEILAEKLGLPNVEQLIIMQEGQVIFDRHAEDLTIANGTQKMEAFRHEVIQCTHRREPAATLQPVSAATSPGSERTSSHREQVVSARLSNGNSYFRFLNPASKNAGIIYPYEELRGSEVIDQTVPEKVKKAFNSNSYNVWNIVVGNHFDCNFFNQGTVQYGNPSSKGMLDYLIFPLIARKLMAHVLDDDIRLDLKTVLSKTLALCVAIPLEIARFGAAIALTLLLAPVAALLYLAKACLPNDEAENPHSVQGMAV